MVAQRRAWLGPSRCTRGQWHNVAATSSVTGTLPTLPCSASQGGMAQTRSGQRTQARFLRLVPRKPDGDPESGRTTCENPPPGHEARGARPKRDIVPAIRSMLSPPTDSRKSRENPGTEDSLDGSLARELRQQFSPPRLEAGQILAERYRILRHLGHGGMGDVYLAEHILAPALRSAIKILRPTVVRETSALVIREASNVAKIRHRHVVRVTDVGMPSDDMAFLVMEYVGQDLGAYARAAGGVLPPPQAVNFCAQVCDALSAAHDQRLVHRDIKPSNCLVHTEDGNDYIVVSDFGLARVLHGEDSTFSEWSMVGSKGYSAGTHPRVKWRGPSVRRSHSCPGRLPPGRR